jgi:hypothetical protein
VEASVLVYIEASNEDYKNLPEEQRPPIVASTTIKVVNTQLMVANLFITLGIILPILTPTIQHTQINLLTSFIQHRQQTVNLTSLVGN